MESQTQKVNPSYESVPDGTITGGGFGTFEVLPHKGYVGFIYVVENGEQVKYYKLNEQFIKLCNLNEIESNTTTKL